MHGNPSNTVCCHLIMRWHHSWAMETVLRCTSISLIHQPNWGLSAYCDHRWLHLVFDNYECPLNWFPESCCRTDGLEPAASPSFLQTTCEGETTPSCYQTCFYLPCYIIVSHGTCYDGGVHRVFRLPVLWTWYFSNSPGELLQIWNKCGLWLRNVAELILVVKDQSSSHKCNISGLPSSGFIISDTHWLGLSEVIR